jgi:hypothetical protein
VRAGSIRATKVSCTGARAVVRRLLTKVSASPACRRAAAKPPPATGCVVTGYHCFRKRSPEYCATVTGKLVQWRESRLVRGPAATQRTVSGPPVGAG